MIKLELTKEELQTLSEKIDESINNDIGRGDFIELENVVEIEIVCSDCHGTGEIATDESDGEGHTMRGVGTNKCHCRVRDEESDE